MSNRTLGLPDALYRYLLEASLREPPVLRRLREATARLPQARMQVAPEQGQFMALLVRLMGATKALEIGVFTGYSAAWVALALPAHGRLICCDIDPDWTAMAQRYWEDAGVAPRIELRLAPALDTLDSLLAEGQAGAFDFVFVDADKTGYPAYYERALALLRPGGLIALDNMLWGGSVADAGNRDPDTVAIRALNARLREDARIDLSLVPIGDGLALARKR